MIVRVNQEPWPGSVRPNRNPENFSPHRTTSWECVRLAEWAKSTTLSLPSVKQNPPCATGLAMSQTRASRRLTCPHPRIPRCWPETRPRPGVKGGALSAERPRTTITRRRDRHHGQPRADQYTRHKRFSVSSLRRPRSGRHRRPTIFDKSWIVAGGSKCLAPRDLHS